MTDTTVDPFSTPGHVPNDVAQLALRAAAIDDLAGNILRSWPAYAAAQGIKVPNPPRPNGMTAMMARHAATIAVDAMLNATGTIFEARSAAEAQTAALVAASDAESEAEQLHTAAPADWGTVHA